MRYLLIARTAAGYEQQDMAEKLGISYKTYQTYEYGTRAGSIENWLKLEDILDISIKKLYENVIKEEAVPISEVSKRQKCK